ncbi:MAG: hypothetical protein ACXVY5_09560, partial [Gaiellales bacterium]
MAVLRDLGVDVEVVEQHEPAGQLAVVRRRPVLEQRQSGVAVALPEIAEHLVVGAVLLDHVDHVADRAQRSGPGAGSGGRMVVAAHLRRPARQPARQPVVLARQVDHLDRTLDHRPGILVLVVAGQILDPAAAPLREQRRERPARIRAGPHAVRVHHHQAPPVGRRLDVRRIPAGRDETANPAPLQVDHGDRILAGLRHVQRAPVRADGKSLGHGALGGAVHQGDIDRGDQPVAPRVDHRHRVAVR